MTYYIKHFKDTPYESICREAEFQKQATEIGIAPNVIHYDEKSIVMENLESLCIADKYGDKIEDVPDWICTEIESILTLLYTMNIEYIDVTPYNFIEKENHVWIVDFGHAQVPQEDNMNWYLKEVFDNQIIEKWNVDFE